MVRPVLDGHVAEVSCGKGEPDMPMCPIMQDKHVMDQESVTGLGIYSPVFRRPSFEPSFIHVDALPT